MTEKSLLGLTPKMPTIIRIDGKAFHTFTRGLEKPWDKLIVDAMTAAAKALMSQIQGAKIAYIQSDEISILINDYERFSKPWFDDGVGKDLQKIASFRPALLRLILMRYLCLLISRLYLMRVVLSLREKRFVTILFGDNKMLFVIPYLDWHNLIFHTNSYIKKAHQ